MADTIDTTSNPPNTSTKHLRTDSPPTSPQTSPTRSPSALSAKRSRSPLSIDLGNLPPLSQPTPPSNTLLITRLSDPKIFHPASLATVRQHLNDIAPLNSFSPLKSMNRIIVSFFSTEAAIRVRQEIDGTAFSTESIAKCYFGEATQIGDEKKYLERPDQGRLFFISPPPSPPIGWESKTEDPPNKEVHAEDLAAKLSNLTKKMGPTVAAEDDSPVEDNSSSKTQLYTSEELSKLKTSIKIPALSGISEQEAASSSSPIQSSPRGRSRSSTLIYDPKEHGDSPNLPAVMLETEDDGDDVQLDSGSGGPKVHTSRPPVELME